MSWYAWFTVYFQLTDYNIETRYVFIENLGFDPTNENTKKFRVRAIPETYFPSLTATKKVDNLIQKYKDPSKSTLPDSVDKTSELYLDMKSCADEAIKDCKTDYEKIITLDQYVHKIMTYDLNSISVSMETAWKTKKGVCAQFAQIMSRLCQIEGIPSCYSHGRDHGCVLSYDSQNKKWIYSDPTNYCEDLNVYGRANNTDWLIENPIDLKYNNNYFSLERV